MSEVIEMFENIWNSRREKEKNIGLCAERAAIGHQLLTIPEKVSFIGKFESFLTHSHMAIDTLVPHAFIVLKNKKDSSKQYIFDIENLIEYKKNDSSELVPAITLYPLTEEKFESFKEKKTYHCNVYMNNLESQWYDQKDIMVMKYIMMLKIMKMKFKKRIRQKYI